MTDRPESTRLDSDRRRFLGAAAVASSAVLAGCFGNGDDGDDSDGSTDDGANDDGPGDGGANDDDGGPGDGPDRSRLPFRVGAEGFERTGSGEFLVRGINLGMAKPGRFPGEAAITRAEYDRWLAAIGELGANVVRVYTIHPPAFYEALAAYNEAADEPLYLLHGAWIGEERLVDFGDATRMSAEFHAELRRVVDAVHGEATLPERAGHASGTYTADVSDFLLGYVIGIEWSPSVVRGTNEAGGETAPGDGGEYAGEFVETVDGSPFERWLAESLDELAGYADAEYGTQRPLSFTNWVTTDPLTHPYEPYSDEDAVSVDPDAIVPTDAFDAGTFASYHVYPYYPDMLNQTPEYVEYVDHRGERNSYAGYLADLTAATEQPLLVAEFGVPDSRGSAHNHVHGRNQGQHTEREQGEIVAAMYEDIVEAGTAGGLVFTWQDEWFKRTWNVAPFSEPNRRPFWSNVQTPEQRFGLLTFDPAERISLDGSVSEWAEATRFEPAGPATRLSDGNDPQRRLTGLAVTHDEAALSVLLEFDSLADLDWTTMNAVVAIGHTGRGNTTLPLGLDADARPTDFLIRLGGPDDSRLLVDAYYDAFARQYGGLAGLDLEDYHRRDSGRFTPSRMALNYPYTVPPTGERVPFASIEAGRLRYGNGNPDSSAYDSLADVHVSRSNDVIELRIPWLLLNVADPSSRTALGDLWAGSVETFEQFDRVSVSAGTYRPSTDGTATEVPGETNFTHAVPGIDGRRLRAGRYTWERWNEPSYTERRKESYRVVQRKFSKYR